MKDVASGALLLGLSTFALSAVAAPVVIDLPKQPLAAALEQLQSASGMRISYDRAQVAKVGAPALKGNMEAGEALDRLLADSGLQGLSLIHI